MERRCRELGRTMQYGLSACVLTADTDAEAIAIADCYMAQLTHDPSIKSASGAVGANLIGTPKTVAERIRRYRIAWDRSISAAVLSDAAGARRICSQGLTRNRQDIRCRCQIKARDPGIVSLLRTSPSARARFGRSELVGSPAWVDLL